MEHSQHGHKNVSHTVYIPGLWLTQQEWRPHTLVAFC